MIGSRSVLAVLVTGMSIALAGCGGDQAQPVASLTRAAAPTEAVATSAATPTAGGDAAGAQCAELPAESLERFGYTVQLLAQVSLVTLADLSPGGAVAVDLDAFDADIARLRALEGVDTEGLGDVGEALDYYAGLSQAARELIDSGDQVTQEDIDAYEQEFGGISGVIGAQLPIAAAYDAACG